MTREQLIEQLHQLAKSYDLEAAHMEADRLLLEYVNDPEIDAAFEAIEKWYA